MIRFLSLWAVFVIAAPTFAQTQPTTRLASDIPPTLVNFSKQNVPPDAVFEEIEKQCRVEFKPMPDKLFDLPANQKPISVDYKDTPFWVAVLDLSAKSGLTVNASAFGPGPLTIMKAPLAGEEKRPTIVCGGFVVALNSILATRQVSFAHTGMMDTALVTMTIYVDPKVKLAAHAMSMRVDEAVDDKGESLKQDLTPGREMPIAMQTDTDKMLFSVSGAIKPPRQTGGKLARLKGSIDMMLATGSDTFELPNLLEDKDKSKKIGRWTVTIKEASLIEDGKAVQIKATEVYEGPAVERGTAPLQIGKMTDTKGNVMKLNAYTGIANEVTAVYRPLDPAKVAKPAPGPIKLILEVSTDQQRVRIPVEFKDLPLP